MTTGNQLRKDVEILKRALNVGVEPKWKKRYNELQPILARLNELGWNSPTLKESATQTAKQYAKQIAEGYERIWNKTKGEYEWRKPT